MTEPDPPQRGEPSSQADRTLLGVAPPKLDGSSDGPRSPVFVRAGTSAADVEPQPLPRMALPSRPPRALPEAPGVSEAAPAFTDQGRGMAWVVAMLKLPARVAGTEVALWMVLVPVFAAAALFLMLVGSLLSGSSAKSAAQSPATPASSLPPNRVAPDETAPAKGDKPAPRAFAGLAGRTPESLSSGELLSLAEGRAEAQRDAAQALSRKVAGSPGLGKDKSVQGELLRLAGDAETAREALAAMAALEAPIGADLLYEVWTGTSQRTATTELARTLVYSTDVRPKASQALSVALELRVAERCEQYKTVLPNALKDGDRRALHLLTKLSSKRGCGPKKNEDCFACLREQTAELTATINAVKSRRAPVYLAPLP